MRKNNMTRKILFLALAGLVFLSACKTTPASKKYPNMVADMDPVSTGTINAEFDKMLSLGLEKREIQTYFRPRENTVSLEFRYETVLYRQVWPLQGREAFKRAIKQYKQDFSDRILVDKSSTRGAYGKIKGKAEWSSTSLSISEKYHSNPQIDLGYTFKRGSPYFQVLMYAASAEKNITDEVKQSSLRIPIYYTIAQAEELAAIFDQDWLVALLGPKGEDGYYQAERDEYQMKQNQNGAAVWFGDLIEGVTGNNPFDKEKSSSESAGDSYDSTAVPAKE